MRTVIFLLLAVLSMAAVSCDKKSDDLKPQETALKYEAVFAFEADESVSKFVLEVSDNGSVWRDAAVALPDASKVEYVIPYTLPIRRDHFARIRGVTTAGTEYFSEVKYVPVE